MDFLPKICHVSFKVFHQSCKIGSMCSVTVKLENNYKIWFVEVRPLYLLAHTGWDCICVILRKFMVMTITIHIKISKLTQELLNYLVRSLINRVGSQNHVCLLSSLLFLKQPSEVFRLFRPAAVTWVESRTLHRRCRRFVLLRWKAPNSHNLYKGRIPCECPVRIRTSTYKVQV